MTGNLERYLRQQIELGGREAVVRSPGLGIRDSGVGSREPEINEPVINVGAASRPPVRQPGTESSQGWREGAPPIPGPGFTVDPPRDLPAEMAALDSLEAIAEVVRQCGLCPLGRTRANAVPGEGNPDADLMLVGEGPGQNEDETGRPFVGRAGELLDRILGSIELPRESVFIANIVKCRPPGNRKPLPEEATSCIPYLHRQIALIKPKVLMALGGTAAESLLGMRMALGKLRGKVHHYGDIPLIVTYHPAALLRNPNWKKPTWDDVRIARQLLEV